MRLLEYIAAHHGGNQSEFARHMEVNRHQVSKWVADGWIVVDGKLYSPRRDIPVIIEAPQ
jgi:hypothetical protein